MVFELLLNEPLNLLLTLEESSSLLSFTLGPAIEETAKALLLFALFFYYSFDDVTDGIVYGAIVGFGFSASENLLSFMSSYFTMGASAWIATIILRLMVTSLAHGVFTAMVGAGLGFIKTNRIKKQRHLDTLMIPLTLLAAIMLHSLFNVGVLLTQYLNPLFILINIALVLAGVTILLLVMFIYLEAESHLIKKMLYPELVNGFIIEGEYNIIPYYLSRKKASRTISKKHGKEGKNLLDKLFYLETRLAFKKKHLTEPYSGELEDTDARIKKNKR